ncbi:MAG: YfhO family protein [Lachnospiraceae bacterium]|nr:YfhO family protein [Lachnospiraceae bacterium]
MTKSKMQNKKSLDILYLTAFLLPVLVMLIIFAVQNIFPFGDRSFLNIDMYHQYFPFLTEFYHKVKNGESLFYSWNTGIGSNFLALYVYYLATPTNWLALLCPEQYLMEFISYMVIIKIGLCGFSFTYYIRNHFKNNSPIILCFATMYALSGYMAAYNWNVMWLDCIVLAPVIIWGLEKLVNEGISRLYCLTLALAILSNYYICIMICIFLVLYFFVLLIGRNPIAEDTSRPITFPVLCRIRSFYGKAIVRFGIYSLLAGGMSAILLLPEIAALRFTEFTAFNFPDEVKTYFSVIDMLARHCFNVEIETGLGHWPNIYCGVAVFLLLPLYIMQKKIPIREKAAKLILLAFILISFSTNTLNFIWHGLNYPDSLPARQSFLYIFLVLIMCFEAFLYIREQSRTEVMNVFLSILFFILLLEKLITDDAFTGVSFLVTGIFLICYGALIHMYRSQEKMVKQLAIIAIVLVVTETGLNTYLTSCSTVSRTTYLSNYDSYQELTSRTMEEEDDFFRFEKFARRTQNDAMLIGFPAGSYFSSVSNALVKDFYEKYGMKSSKVYYCYDGATPVTAALLANRYMLYTLDRGYDNLFELAETEGKLYMYRNNYSLPLGYMVAEAQVSSTDMDIITAHHNALTQDTATTSTDISTSIEEDAFEELFTSADEIEDSLHDGADYNKSINPLERQNELVHQLGVSSNVFIPVTVDQSGDSATITVQSSGHFYAYTRNTKIDTIKMAGEEKSKDYKDIKKKYILDLGYHEAGTTISLSSKNKESLNLSAYVVNEPALAEFINILSAQTMTVDSYDETHINGHITVTNPGQLVLSVPYEPGWTLFINGKETPIDLFENTFISVYLPEGEHTISLSFFPKGFIPGVIVSLLCLAIYIAIELFHKYKSNK